MNLNTTLTSNWPKYQVRHDPLRPQGALKTNITIHLMTRVSQFHLAIN